MHARNALNVLSMLRLRLNGGRSRLRVTAEDSGNHHPIFFLAWFADVDATLKEGSITDADALGGHTPSHRTFTADVHTVADIDITHEQ
jgi:hypothetical protein